MSIEDIIRAWKAEEESLEPLLPESPVGRDLTQEEALAVSGGVDCGSKPTLNCRTNTAKCSDINTANNTVCNFGTVPN
jgi:hypothetical protein